MALKRLGANRDFMRALCERKTQVQAGFVAIDPRNGAIRAWVGSPDFGSEPFDHVSQARRQPGSTFAFVYGAAFADGMRPGDTFMDRPLRSRSTGARSGARPMPSRRPMSR